MSSPNNNIRCNTLAPPTPMICAAPQQPQVGVFSFQSNKQARLNSVQQGRCVAHIFAMHVGEELEAWPEHPQRQRRWVSGFSPATLPPRPAACHTAFSPEDELQPCGLITGVVPMPHKTGGSMTRLTRICWWF